MVQFSKKVIVLAPQVLVFLLRPWLIVQSQYVTVGFGQFKSDYLIEVVFCPPLYDIEF